MIGFKGMSIDMLVTPDHRVLASSTTTRELRSEPRFSLVPAFSVLGRAHRHITTAKWTGAETQFLTFDDMYVPARPFLALVGLFIGDGNLGRSNHINFRLRKPREIAFLEASVHAAKLELRRWGQDRYAIPVLPEMRLSSRRVTRTERRSFPGGFFGSTRAC